MNAPMSLNDLSHGEILAWLERALRGQELLPRLTPDESPHLGILRLEKSLKPAARDSLRDGCLQLVRQFCAEGRGKTAYVEELLCLASAFKSPESVQMLAQLARDFPEFPGICVEVRIAVLAALVDTPPPQPPEYWNHILKQAPEDYAGLALSGVLATNPAEAIRMLSALPDTERVGQAAALKLDLAWDDLPPRQRFQFIQGIQAILPQCGSRSAGAVRAWADSKERNNGAGLFSERSPGPFSAAGETECRVTLTRSQLTHTLIALQAYAKSLTNREGENVGGDYEDLLLVDGIIRQLEAVRDKKADIDWIAAEE